MLIRAWELDGLIRGCWMIEAAASDAAVTRGSIGCILMILSYPLSKLVL